MEGPLLGQQMPRYYNVPERHEQQVDGCIMCKLEAEEEKHNHGCGDHVASPLTADHSGFSGAGRRSISCR